jgi:hypothetical protein
MVNKSKTPMAKPSGSIPKEQLTKLSCPVALFTSSIYPLSGDTSFPAPVIHIVRT